jgi:ABC-2 type transport system ATP-binding protein
MDMAIRAEKLTVKLEKDAVLRDVTVTVPKGQVAGLLGPSGAGKTTLMKAMVGLQRPTSGSVEVLGERAGSAKLRSRIGYVTQSPSVYADLTVEENLKFFGAMVGVGRERIKRVIGDVRLSKQTGQLVGSLSGGQRARVSLAVAMLGEPELLILDEPTVGLDPVLRQELWGQFHELAQRGTTLLISSHVMDEAVRCEHLILMREGGVLATGTPAELMERTDTHDVESAFLRLVEGPK